MTFNEREYLLESQQRVINDFEQHVKELDDRLKREATAKGWHLLKTSSRTVSFTFGTVTLWRRCYEDREGVLRYPVDEELGLVPWARFSREVLYDLVQLTTEMSYRRVAEFYTEKKNIPVSKDIVCRAVKMARQLYEEKEEYRIIKDQSGGEGRKSVKKIYVEGDGIVVKTKVSEDSYRFDMSHFIVHEGVRRIGNNRKELINKKEFIGPVVNQVRTQVEDYLFNNYSFDSDCIMISNSDMGSGYYPASFKGIVSTFSIAHHDHYWDRYHLNKKIRKLFDGPLISLQSDMFLAIRQRDKAKIKAIVDTAESMIGQSTQWEALVAFTNKLLRYFITTITPKQRGYTSDGIGVMESNNAKIAFRMKHRGMYWSVPGALTMARLIIDQKAGQLRNLFFGDWREKYRKLNKIANHGRSQAVANSRLKNVNLLLKRNLRSHWI